jgi:hypothetical protein
MLTKIEVDDLQGHTLSLPLFDAPPGYLVTGIDGLDPVKSTIVSSSFGQLDGSQFQSSRRENRNIVMRVRMEPYSGGSTVAQLRSLLYQYFMPKTNVILKFYNDNTLAYLIQGQVESCETPLFTKEPEMSVSIMCFDPNFYAPSPVTINSSTVSGNTELAINNVGSVETGYVFTIPIDRTISGFSILNRRPSGAMAQLDFTAALAAGNIVTISTEFKNKYANLRVAGAEASALYAVSPSSKWGPLYAGINYFRVLVAGAAIPYSVVYTPKYGGI